MQLAIMQPYFFPYIGYFQLIHAVDKFILLDTVQFIRHGWIERNRILKQNGDWLYIKVPLKKHARDTLIKDIEIRSHEAWQNTVLAQLQAYKKIAPEYYKTIALIKEIFNERCESITELNVVALKKIGSFLDIDTPISIFSEMDIVIDEVNDAGEWALNISKSLDAQCYVNPIGGAEIFDADKFLNHNIALKFLQSKDISYDQKRSKFEQALSIIDVLMFNSPAEIQSMLNHYSLVQ